MKRTLKSIRADLGMTQKEMAAKLGISKTSYLKRETGQTPLLARELLQISIMSNVPCENIEIPV